MQKKPVEKETAKEVVKAAETKAAAEVKTAVKETEAAAKEAVKAVVKKAEPAVKKAESAAKKVEPAVKKAEATVKSAVKKTAAKTATKKPAVKKELVPEVYIQFDGSEVEVKDVVDKAREAFVADGHKSSTIKSLRVYLKPEEYAAYYVVNEKYAGRVDLF